MTDLPDILSEEVERVPIDAVREHPANPRDGDVAAIQESIRENSFYNPLIVQESSGKVLAGNHRLKAARAEEMAEIPIVYVDVGDEEALRILLADNRTSDVAGYEENQLADLLQHLESTPDGFSGTGYMGDDLNELLDDLGRIPGNGEVDDPGAETSRADELQEKWGTDLGQLWQVGRHRLLCGDATDEGDVERLLDGAEPRLLVTDPPYGIDIGSQSQGEGGGVAKKNNYGKNDWDKEVPLEVIRREVSRHPISVLWGGNHFTEVLPSSRGWFVWDKKNGNTDFADIELAWTSLDQAAKLFAFKWAGMLQEDMANKEERFHPTQKPVELARWCMQQCGKGDVVDLFAGAGWTVIAAEQEGRTCYAMEIDPGYVAVILERCSEAGMECDLISQ